MKMTVKNLLSFSTLKKARIIAGKKGVYNNVNGVTVLEIAGDEVSGAIELMTESAKRQDIMISALYTAKDDIAKQCKTIESMHRLNVSGLIVFYYGKIIRKFSDEVIQLCDRLNFPLIVVDYETNKEVSYEDVMKEIFAMLKRQDEYFHRRAISAMWKEWENGGTVRDVLMSISRYILSDITIASFTSKQVLLSTEETYDERLIEKIIEESITGNNRHLINEGDETCWVENYHSDKLDVIIILKTSSKNQFQDWMLSCVKLCIDVYNEELALTGNDEIIKLLIEGTFDINMPILSEKEHSKWSFLVAEGIEENLFKAFICTLDSGKIPYLKGMFKSYKVVLLINDDNFCRMQDEIKELFSTDQQGICVYVDQISSKSILMECLSRAIALFHYYKVVFPFRNIIEWSEIKVLNNNVNCTDECENRLKEALLDPLKRFDEEHNGCLMKTLQAFMVDFNGDYYKTSQHLFVHKNTIQYRINSAMEILNINLKDNSQMLYLYDALIADRIKTRK